MVLLVKEYIEPKLQQNKKSRKRLKYTRNLVLGKGGVSNQLGKDRLFNKWRCNKWKYFKKKPVCILTSYFIPQ